MRFRLGVLALCLLFVGLGAWRLDGVGIQTDEALFAGALYPPFHPTVRIFTHDVPVMVMQYVGAAKGWLYAPLLATWEPTAFVVRMPMVLLGAATIALFAGMAARVAGRRGAMLATALLATDTSFLLTTRWDWGPVAIQHFCVAGALYAFVRFRDDDRSAWVLAGSYLLGFGLWDKAIFIWVLAGLAAGAAVALLPAIRERMTVARGAGAVACFLLGAAPLVVYNVRYDGITFRGNTAFSTDQMAEKLHLLRTTVNGHSLFGMVMREDNEPKDSQIPWTAAERQMALWNREMGSPRYNLQLKLFVASLLLFPLAWRRQRAVILFGVVFLVVAWGMMAITRNAGNSSHHVILLWPIPHLLLAAVCQAATGRWAIGAALAVVLTACSNLAVTSTYFRHQMENGSTAIWSDAIFGVPEALREMGVERLYVADWGLFDNTRLLMRGSVEMRSLEPGTSRESMLEILTDPMNSGVFLCHTPGNAVQPQIVAQLHDFLAKEGFEKYDERLLRDSQGRPVIELFRVRKATG